MLLYTCIWNYFCFENEPYIRLKSTCGKYLSKIRYSNHIFIITVTGESKFEWHHPKFEYPDHPESFDEEHWWWNWFNVSIFSAR